MFDATASAAMERELEAHARRSIAFDMRLTYVDLLFVASLVQIGLSDPTVTPGGLEAGELFLQAVRTYFKGCPTVVRSLSAPDAEPRH